MPFYNQTRSTGRYGHSRPNKVFYNEKPVNTEKLSKAPVIFGRDTSHEAARTPWPRFGRISFQDLDKSQPKADFRRADFESGLDIHIYMAGCKGLLGKAQDWKLPLFKVGVTAIPDLLVRQRDLNQDAYGSCFYENGQAISEEGWTNWEMRQLELSVEPDPASPVKAVARGLRVRLPAGFAAEDFDKALHARLYPCALHAFARSAAGQKHFGLLGIDSVSVPRYIAYGFGSGVRFSAANEIYLCRPREDWSRLRIIAEALIGEFLAKQKAI